MALLEFGAMRTTLVLVLKEVGAATLRAHDVPCIAYVCHAQSIYASASRTARAGHAHTALAPHELLYDFVRRQNLGPLSVGFAR